MKRRLRKRRVLKWIGVGLCVVSGSIWIACSIFNFGYAGSQIGALFSNGSMQIVWETNEEPDGWETWPSWPGSRRSAIGWPSVESYGESLLVEVPLWLLFGFPAILTILLFRMDRVADIKCLKCAFVFAGLERCPCPKCGEFT